jgi:uncharacterized protein
VQVSDQSEVCAFLAAAMGERGGVEEFETHISHIFVGPERAWKLKRAVRLPYADFSTPEKRLAFCEREVALNRRTAPEHYLGVRRITRQGDGLALDGAGALVDAVVEMRRFDQDALLDRLATRGALTAPLMERLAVEIARLHDACAPDPHPGSHRVAEVLAVNEAALSETHVFARDEVAAFNAAFRAAAEAHRPLLDERGEAGQVRLAHGDLHLRNIFLEGGEPVIFDCIEFNEALATVDLLYDLGFLLMDLVHRGLPGFSNLVMNRYLDLTGDEGGLPLLPFFMALRAAVRAHVTATAIEDGEDTPERRQEGRAYFDLALNLMRPQRPVLLAIGGFSGTGKSTVAGAAAPLIGTGAGARVLASDRLRKAFFGVAPETRLPSDAYRPDISAQIYEELDARAAALVSAGVPVVADAVFARPGERDRIEAAARAAQAAFHGFWLDAPAKTLRARVAGRAGGPSDATVAVLEQQLGYDLGSMRWTRLDASRPPDALAGIIRDAASIKPR